MIFMCRKAPFCSFHCQGSQRPSKKNGARQQTKKNEHNNQEGNENKSRIKSTTNLEQIRYSSLAGDGRLLWHWARRMSTPEHRSPWSDAVTKKQRHLATSLAKFLTTRSSTNQSGGRTKQKRKNLRGFSHHKKQVDSSFLWRSTLHCTPTSSEPPQTTHREGGNKKTEENFQPQLSKIAKLHSSTQHGYKNNPLPTTDDN